MVLFALSFQGQVEKYGVYVGIAAFFGLAVLSLLYFSQARELKRLREWAGRAPERARELEQRVVAQASANVARRGQAPAGAPGRPAMPPRRLAEMPEPPAAQPAAAGQATEVAEPGAADPAMNGSVPPAEGAEAAAQVANGTAPADAPPADEGELGEAAAAGAAVAGAAAAGATADERAEDGAGDSAAPEEVDAERSAAEAERADEPAAEAGLAGQAAGDADQAARDAERAGQPAAEAGAADEAAAEAGLAGQAVGAGQAPADAEGTGQPAADDDTGERPDVAPGEVPAAAAVPRATPAQRVGVTPRPAPLPLRQSRPSASPAGGRTATRRPGAQPARRPGAKPARAGRSAGTIALFVGLAVLILGGGAFVISQLGGDDNPPAPNRAAPPSTQTGGNGGGAAPAPTQSPSETNVAVLNGTTSTGLAARIADRVAQEGYVRGVTQTNTRDQTIQASTVYYADGYRDNARAIGRLLGIDDLKAIDADTQALAPDADIVVLAGADQAS
jgi:hypothetical protein